MNFDTVGRFPPPNLALSKQDIHIWYAFLDQPTVSVQQLMATLSSDELSKARSFYFEQDRKRYTVCRGLLRRILSYYLKSAPHQLQFRYGSRGKPALAELPGSNSISFNLSHSHELALYAVTQGREIGIDLEHMRHMPEVERIVDQFFSAREVTVFHALHPHEQQEAFFKGWTSKEAYLKAIGEGLSCPLSHIEVSLCPEEPA